MEKKINVCIEDVSFTDWAKHRMMRLDCVRPSGQRLEITMGVGEHSPSRTHRANFSHLRQMLKLYGIRIEDTQPPFYLDKPVWAQVVGKFYRLKVDELRDGRVFLRRVEGTVPPFEIASSSHEAEMAKAEAVLAIWGGAS